MYELKIAKPYVPEKIPDKEMIKECCDNIAEIARGMRYPEFSYVVEMLNDILTACGIECDYEECENG